MLTPDIHIVSEAIRDAVAPVFLLTGIGSILNVMVGRLAIIFSMVAIIVALLCFLREILLTSNEVIISSHID